MTAPTVSPPAHPKIRVVPPDPADPGSFRAGQLEILVEVEGWAVHLGPLSSQRLRELVSSRHAELAGGGR